MVKNFYDYSGVVHVHTTFSGDSELPPESLVSYAKRFNVDFVIITDHNSIEAKYFEGFHDGILFLVGEEITPEEGNHLLAFDINKFIPPARNPQKMIDEVNKQGGLSFIEHPFFNGNKYIKHRVKMKWLDWNVKDFTGMSIFNYTCDGGERMTPLLMVIFYFFPGLDRDRPNEDTIRKWDELTLKRKTVGIGTVDAHFVYFRFGKKKIETFPFIYYFNSIRTHVLCEDKISPQCIYEAMRKGHVYVSHNYLGLGKGFIFWAEVEDKNYIMGDELEFREGIKLFAKTPLKAKIRIIKDGKKIKEVFGREISYKVIEPGVYRIETDRFHRLHFNPWIYSNPIYIR